jgi:hypothetical protein
MIHNFFREDHEQIRRDVKEMQDFVKQLNSTEAKPSKKYFCWNLIKNRLIIGLWSIPDIRPCVFPCFSFFNCKFYTKLGIKYKRNLFEIVWNKDIDYIMNLNKRFDQKFKMD